MVTSTGYWSGYAAAFTIGASASAALLVVSAIRIRRGWLYYAAYRWHKYMAHRQRKVVYVVDEQLAARVGAFIWNIKVEAAQQRWERAETSISVADWQKAMTAAADGRMGRSAARTTRRFGPYR